MEIEEDRGPEDAADVAERRRARREEEERQELKRRSTVLKVRERSVCVVSVCVCESVCESERVCVRVCVCV